MRETICLGSNPYLDSFALLRSIVISKACFTNRVQQIDLISPVVGVGGRGTLRSVNLYKTQYRTEKESNRPAQKAPDYSYFTTKQREPFPTTKFTSIDQAYLLNDTILFILLNHLGHRFGQQWTTLLDIASMLAPCPGLTMCSGRRQDFVAGQGSLCFAVKYE